MQGIKKLLQGVSGYHLRVKELMIILRALEEKHLVYCYKEGSTRKMGWIGPDACKEYP